MRAIKHFDEFIQTGIVKNQSPDSSRADFLKQESKKSYSFLQKKIKTFGIDDETANDLIKSCYDIVMELIRAKMLLEGYNASGQGAHEAEVSYLRILRFKEKDVQFADAIHLQPTWNSSTNTYNWPNGLSQTDYPAFNRCITLELEGYNDWRLPTVEEFQNLGYELIGGWGSINLENFGFLDYIHWEFWTSNESSAVNSRGVYLFNGVSFSTPKTSIDPVVCVRENN